MTVSHLWPEDVEIDPSACPTCGLESCENPTHVPPFDPSDSPFYPVCQFHALTGLDCPGCGSLRALHELLHGNLAGAFRFNALLVLSLPGACWLGGRCALRLLKNQPATIAIRPAWLWGALVVMLLFGVMRNLPFDCLAWLGP